MKKTIIALIVSLLQIVALRAQYQLSGTVQDESVQGIPFANVLLLSTKDSTLVKGGITDELGKFSLKNIEASNYIFSVSSLGYESLEKRIEISSDKNLGVLQLQGAPEALDEVMVKAKKPLFEQKIDRMVINVQENISAAGGTALDVLERSPGVSLDRGRNSLGLNGKDGIVILINGKRSRQSIEAIMQTLSAMSSGNIEAIELITTPPAKYDADGNAGIINIQMAKTTDLGTNGSISSHVGYGLKEKAGISLNLNHRKNKINSYGDLSLNWDRKEEVFTNDRMINNTSEILTSNSVSNREPKSYGINGKLGLDYQFSEKVILGTFVSGYANVWDMDSFNNGFDASSVSPTTFFEVDSRELAYGKHFTGNINLNYKISESSDINFDTDYLWYDNVTDVDYNNFFFDASGSETNTSIIKTEKDTPIHVFVGKIDYSSKLSTKLKLETGIKGTATYIDNDVIAEDHTNEIAVIDENLSEKSNLTETIGAVYTTLNYEINAKTQINLGLRYEYSETELDITNEDNVVDFKINEVFPTFFLSREIAKETTLQFSYGRRITRPSFSDLAPFFIYINPTTFFYGNTQLKPSLSDNLKIDLKYKKYILTIEYNHQDNAIMRYQPIVLDDNQQVITSLNLDYNDTYNAILSVPIKFNSWWSMNLNIMGIRRKLETLENEKFDKSFIKINASKSFKLPSDFSLELSGYYQTESMFGLAGLSEYKGFGAGIQKTFTNNSKLRLNFNHQFEYDVFVGEGLEKDAYTNTTYRFEPHIFRLSYSYEFGNNKLKDKRNRNSASEEIKKRVH